MNAHFAVAASATLAVFAAAGPECRAAAVNLTGDLGVRNFSGGPGTLPSGQSFVTPFSRSVAGRGSITGDVIADNTGTALHLTVTNLLFQALDWSPIGATIVRVDVAQFFAAAPGSYSASNAIAGSMGSSTGGCFVGGQTFFDDVATRTFVPAVSFGSPQGLEAFSAFSIGPTSATGSVGITTVLVVMQLDMTIQGDGFISLPTSFDSTTTAVPAPAAGMVFALAGLRAAPRRRRA